MMSQEAGETQEIVNSKKGLVRRMQELAIQYQGTELGGNFRPRRFGKYSMTYHTGTTTDIKISKEFPGAWHTHTGRGAEGIIKDLQIGYPTDMPAHLDAYWLITAPKVREKIVIGPYYTTQLQKDWKHGQEPPLATYLIKLYGELEFLATEVQNNEESQKLSKLIKKAEEIERDRIKNIIGDSYPVRSNLFLFCIEQFLSDYGSALSLIGRLGQIWPQFYSHLGLRVKISENPILNPAYDPNMKEKIPIVAQVIKPTADIGKDTLLQISNAQNLRELIEKSLKETYQIDAF